jgi:hypothetical protein
MRFTKYVTKNPTKAYACLNPDEWIYDTGFAVDTDAGVVTIGMEKPGRVFSLGVAQGNLLLPTWKLGDLVFRHYAFDGFFTFDRRIVAMVAEFLMHHGWGKGEAKPYPKLGEEIYLPTAEEADEIYKKYNIPTPQNNQDCDNLFCDCVEVGDDGKPLNPNDRID